MNQEYLLTNERSKYLYHQIANKFPVIDYHNHLSIKDMADNRMFENITQLWIVADPYKHRAMRILGVPENKITGVSTDYEKFEAWCHCLPKLLGNPLYDWAVMEFEMVFGLSAECFSKDPGELWKLVNEKLRDLPARKIQEKFSIEYSAPCTSLADDLGLFQKMPGWAPSLRGDDMVGAELSFIQTLEKKAGCRISGLEVYKSVIMERLFIFANSGCRFSDHALDDGFIYIPDDGKNDMRFQQIISGGSLAQPEQYALASEMLRWLGNQYAKYGFTMQLHIGARRKTSTRLRKIAGKAGGFAAIGGNLPVESLILLLDDMEKSEEGLPHILLFNLNPADNAVTAALSGSYSKDGIKTLVSQGPAWWWCDHYKGIWNMLDDFSAYSVLSTFIGMTTDSRSLLSFVRHDYFRRILCEWLVEQVHHGILPDNDEILKELITLLCYQNAHNRLMGGEKNAF